MTLLFSFSAFADSKTPLSAKDSDIKDSTISYISKNDAILLANQRIKGEIEAGDNCPWNQSTKISGIVDLFDFEGNVNAYLFRLATNGKSSGYEFINAYVKTPSVEAFGYDCDFMLDDFLLENHKPKATTNDHIIYAEGLTFLTQNQLGNYFLIGNKSEKLDANKSDLAKNYKKELQSRNNTKARTNLIALKTNSIEFPQTTLRPHDLPGIMSPGYIVYTSAYFHDVNNCAPTAATNLVYYWSHQGSPRETNLWTGRVYEDLEHDMHYDYRGTLNYNILPGIEQFADSRNAPVNETYDDGNGWDMLTYRLDCNYPVIVTIENDPKYGGTNKGHAMLAIGYKRTYDDSYIRVEDGMKATVNNFYEYADYYINGEYSVSW